MDDETSTPGESTAIGTNKPTRTAPIRIASSAGAARSRVCASSRRCITANTGCIWFGQIFASMATWMDQVARGWLLYELTNSTLQLGLIRGVQAIPILLLSPLAGSAADRYSRKNQILIAQIVDGLLYVVVAILIFAGRIEPWHVFVTAVRHVDRAVVPAAVARRHGRRRRANRTYHQRHRLEFDYLQRCAQRRPGVRGLSHRPRRHRRRLYGAGDLLLSRHHLDLATARRATPPKITQANMATTNPSGKASSKAGNSVGATRRCAPAC